HPDIPAARRVLPPARRETAPSALRRAQYSERSFFMRVAEFAQLAPDRHALHPAPRVRQLLQRGLAMVLHEGFELLGIRDLVRMASLIAHGRLDIARGRFACQPRRDGLAMHAKRVACLSHCHSLLAGTNHPNTQILTVRPRHPVPPPERFLSGKRIIRPKPLWEGLYLVVQIRQWFDLLHVFLVHDKRKPK